LVVCLAAIGCGSTEGEPSRGDASWSDALPVDARPTDADSAEPAGDEPERDALAYRGDRVHQIRLGFAMDILGETQTQAAAVADALRVLTLAGPTAPNGRPDLCINQVFRDNFHQCRNPACRQACVGDGRCDPADPDPVIDPDPSCCAGQGLLPVLRGLLEDWNLLLTLANVPYVTEFAGYLDGAGTCQLVSGCDARQEQDVAEDVTLPPTYAETVCELLEKDAWTSFPPVFDGAGICPASRFADADWRDYLEALDASLADAPGEVAYETGNEPDAQRFFWGQAAAFAAKSASIYDAIRRRPSRPPPPIFFGGYTGQTFAPQDAPDAVAATNQAAFLDLYSQYRDDGRELAHTPSFHVFRQVGYGENGNAGLPQEKGWARLSERADTLDLSGGAMTAFNLFGSADYCLDAWRGDLIGSDYFTYELAELLLFAHRHRLARIYFFNLIDFAEKGSKLGFFDEDGRPKPAFDQISRVWQIISGGYQAYELAGPRRIRIVGQRGEILEAALAPLDLPAGASVLDCPSTPVRCLPPNPQLRQNLCTLYEDYRWAIYTDDGRGRTCAGAPVGPGGPCANALPCVLPDACE